MIIVPKLDYENTRVVPSFVFCGTQIYEVEFCKKGFVGDTEMTIWYPTNIKQYESYEEACEYREQIIKTQKI